MDAQATALAIGEDDVATMLPNDRTCDGETESDTGCIGVPRAFNPVERIEDFSRSPRGMPGPLSSTVMTKRPALGIKLTVALPPYFTALSTRLEMARRMPVGRQKIVTPRGPKNVTSSPASEASWQIPSTRALRSTSDRGSCLVSSRAKQGDLAEGRGGCCCRQAPYRNYHGR
jgi:hypothetical protein